MEKTFHVRICLRTHFTHTHIDAQLMHIARHISQLSTLGTIVRHAIFSNGTTYQYEITFTTQELHKAVFHLGSSVVQKALAFSLDIHPDNPQENSSHITFDAGEKICTKKLCKRIADNLTHSILISRDIDLLKTDDHGVVKMPLASLDLPKAAINILRNHELIFVLDVVHKGYKGIKALKGFGPKSQKELFTAIEALGLRMNP